MRIAVTGAGGRLGRALMTALEASPYTGPFGPMAWGRSQLDLDQPTGVGRRLEADRVELVVHAAAWTDSTGCEQAPGLAMQRNAAATAVLAGACAARGIDLVMHSTHEVFDGRRTDGRGYASGDSPGPVTAFGASKLAAERAATAAYQVHAGGRLGIIRSGWLFGAPGDDVPALVLSASGRARAPGGTVRVASGITGSPTWAPDLAEGIAELIGAGDVTGVHHMVNAGSVSLAGWAREVLRLAGIRSHVDETSAAEDYDLPAPGTLSPTAPAWAVLQPTGMPSGDPIRPWDEALADYLPALLRGLSPHLRTHHWGQRR